MNSFLRTILAAAGVSLAANAPASVYELKDISWDNPKFVASFTGSYGFDTEKTPSITAEEKALFEQLSALIAKSPAEAITMLSAAITPESSGALDYTLGNLHFQSGNRDQAIAAYKKALGKFPGFARAYKNMGILYVQNGQYKESLDALLKTASLGSMDGSLLGLIGYAYLNLGQTASALDAYRLALIFEPESRDWRLGKAQCLINVGESDEAIALLDELIVASPGEANLLMLQANAFLGNGDDMKAAANLQIVSEMGKATAVSLTLLGDIFVNKNAPDIALPYYMDALAQSDLGATRMMRIARVLGSREAWKELDTFLVAARKAMGDTLSPQDANTLLNHEAKVALGLNQDERAAEILEQVVSKDPLNGQALLLLADYYQKKDEVDMAALYFKRAADVPDTEADALVQHARLLVRLRDFPEAAKLLQRAQAIRPQGNVETFLAKVESAARAMR